jgi:16S rRNA (guanine966-N2)-methyltransferase
VVVERSSRSPEPAWPSGLERFAEKKYGETRLWYAEPGVEPVAGVDAADLEAADVVDAEARD